MTVKDTNVRRSHITITQTSAPPRNTCSVSFTIEPHASPNVKRGHPTHILPFHQPILLPHSSSVRIV